MIHIMKINEMLADDNVLNKKTTEFLKYLEKCNMVKKGTCRNQVAFNSVKEIIRDPEKFKSNESSTVQFFLSNYEEWNELYGQKF